MPAEIVNLRKARKTRARAGKEAAAKANRIAFGRTKTEKNAGRAEAQRRERALEGHALDGRASPDPDAKSGDGAR